MSSPTDVGSDRRVLSEDSLPAMPAAALSAVLDLDQAPHPGDVLRPLWHWLYFRPVIPQSALGTDGHPRLGGFLPDLALPRRMWAGGRLQFHAPLRLGVPATQVSRVKDIRRKNGRAGPLAILTIHHAIKTGNIPAIDEEQDIVYRAAAVAGEPIAPPCPAPRGYEWRREIEPTEVLLFRYSALTFNSHRIHYDRPYATELEGYPNLVVHAPLIATLLMDLLHRSLPGSLVVQFTYRAVQPAFLGHSLALCARMVPERKEAELWASDQRGGLLMSARAAFT